MGGGISNVFGGEQKKARSFLSKFDEPDQAEKAEDTLPSINNDEFLFDIAPAGDRAGQKTFAQDLMAASSGAAAGAAIAASTPKAKTPEQEPEQEVVRPQQLFFEDAPFTRAEAATVIVDDLPTHGSGAKSDNLDEDGPAKGDLDQGEAALAAAAKNLAASLDKPQNKHPRKPFQKPKPVQPPVETHRVADLTTTPMTLADHDAAPGSSGEGQTGQGDATHPAPASRPGPVFQPAPIETSGLPLASKRAARRAAIADRSTPVDRPEGPSKEVMRLRQREIEPIEEPGPAAVVPTKEPEPKPAPKLRHVAVDIAVDVDADVETGLDDAQVLPVPPMPGQPKPQPVQAPRDVLAKRAAVSDKDVRAKVEPKRAAPVKAEQPSVDWERDFPPALTPNPGRQRPGAEATAARGKTAQEPWTPKPVSQFGKRPETPVSGPVVAPSSQEPVVAPNPADQAVSRRSIPKGDPAEQRLSSHLVAPEEAVAAAKDAAEPVVARAATHRNKNRSLLPVLGVMGGLLVIGAAVFGSYTVKKQGETASANSASANGGAPAAQPAEPVQSAEATAPAPSQAIQPASAQGNTETPLATGTVATATDISLVGTVTDSVTPSTSVSQQQVTAQTNTTQTNTTQTNTTQTTAIDEPTAPTDETLVDETLVIEFVAAGPKVGDAAPNAPALSRYDIEVSSSTLMPEPSTDAPQRSFVEFASVSSDKSTALGAEDQGFAQVAADVPSGFGAQIDASTPQAPEAAELTPLSTVEIPKTGPVSQQVAALPSAMGGGQTPAIDTATAPGQATVETTVDATVAKAVEATTVEVTTVEATTVEVTVETKADLAEPLIANAAVLDPIAPQGDQNLSAAALGGKIDVALDDGLKLAALPSPVAAPAQKDIVPTIVAAPAVEPKLPASSAKTTEPETTEPETTEPETTEPETTEPEITAAAAAVPKKPAQSVTLQAPVVDAAEPTIADTAKPEVAPKIASTLKPVNATETQPIRQFWRPDFPFKAKFAASGLLIAADQLDLGDWAVADARILGVNGWQITDPDDLPAALSDIDVDKTTGQAAVDLVVAPFGEGDPQSVALTVTFSRVVQTEGGTVFETALTNGRWGTSVLNPGQDSDFVLGDKIARDFATKTRFTYLGAVEDVLAQAKDEQLVTLSFAVLRSDGVGVGQMMVDGTALVPE